MNEKNGIELLPNSNNVAAKNKSNIKIQKSQTKRHEENSKQRKG